MDMGGRVVVVVTPLLLTNAKTGMHAARILELGLTAYGQTAEEALRKVKRMFAASVKAHRELGTLADWLNRSELKWSSVEDYAGPLPVENAEHSNFQVIASPPAERSGADCWYNATQYAMAA